MEIGIDVGGTKIFGALIDGETILKEVKVEVGAKLGKEHVVSQLRSVIATLSEGVTVSGVGIGMPGLVDGNRIVRLPHISCLDGVDLSQELRLDIPIAVDNDANCFTLGEFCFGAARGYKNVIGVTLGTGIGGGFVFNGHFYWGSHGEAGEVGHIMLDPTLKSHRPVLDRGEWEDYVGGPAFYKQYVARGGTGTDASDIWRLDEPAALFMREEAARLFALYIANLLRMLDPDLVVVGGGAGNPQLVEDANRLLPNFGCRQILKRGTLGPHAQVLGAVALLRERVQLV